MGLVKGSGQSLPAITRVHVGGHTPAPTRPAFKIGVPTGIPLGLSMQVDVDTFTHVLSDTLQLSRRYRLSSYDASYLELALRNGGPIATLDDDLRRAAIKAGVKIFKPT
jgi:PIN domain